MNDPTIEVRPPKDMYEYQKAVRDSDLPTTAKTLAFVISTYYNWTNRADAFPSRKVLANGAGIGKSTVSKALNTLQGAGYVFRNQRWDNSNLYEVTLPVVTDVDTGPDPRERRAPSVYETTQAGKRFVVSAGDNGLGHQPETNYELNNEENSEPKSEPNCEVSPALPYSASSASPSSLHFQAEGQTQGAVLLEPELEAFLAENNMDLTDEDTPAPPESQPDPWDHLDW